MKKSELRNIIKEEIKNTLKGTTDPISQALADKMGVKTTGGDYSKNVMKPKEGVKEEEKSIYALALQYLNELKPEIEAIANEYKKGASLSNPELEAKLNSLISSKTDNEDIKSWMKKGISGAFFKYFKKG